MSNLPQIQHSTDETLQVDTVWLSAALVAWKCASLAEQLAMKNIPNLSTSGLRLKLGEQLRHLKRERPSNVKKKKKGWLRNGQYSRAYMNKHTCTHTDPYACVPRCMHLHMQSGTVSDHASELIPKTPYRAVNANGERERERERERTKEWWITQVFVNSSKPFGTNQENGRVAWSTYLFGCRRHIVPLLQSALKKLRAQTRKKKKKTRIKSVKTCPFRSLSRACSE